MTRGRLTFGLGLHLCLAAVTCLASACGGDGDLADVHFQVSVPADDPSCGSGAQGSVGGLPCATVRMFRQLPDGRLLAVRLFDPDEEHEAAGGGATERRVLLDEDRQIDFDARLDPTERHTLVFRIYDDDLAPIYGATVENARFAGEEARVRVRLYPFREWQCPGRASADEGNAPRALHSAVPLPNGDVLFLGGVTGEGISPTSISRPNEAMSALLQRAVELYDADQHRFVRVTGTDRVGEAGFGRVFFGTSYRGTDDDGRHRLLVIGGYELPADVAGSAALLLDASSGGFAAYGLPFIAHRQARVAPSVEILFDPVALTFETREFSGAGAVPNGAFALVSEPLAPSADTNVSAVLLGVSRVLADPTQHPPISSTFYYLADDGTAQTDTLLSPRVGATVTALPAIGGFLVWGGNATEVASPDTLGRAGELVYYGDRPADAVAIASGGDLPPAVAFHTATRFGGPSTVVLAGGQVIRSADGHIGTDPPDPQITALRISPDGAVRAQPVVRCAEGGSCPHTNTSMHTATDVPGLGLVLAGGYRTGTDPLGQPLRFLPLSQVGLVTPAFGYEETLPELTFPRFGHTATLLDGDRLLVVGGLRSDPADASTLSTLRQAEIIYLAQAPERLLDGTCVDVDLPDLDAGVDAGARPDADVSDGGDAGPPAQDASLDGTVAPPPDGDVAPPDSAVASPDGG